MRTQYACLYQRPYTRTQRYLSTRVHLMYLLRQWATRHLPTGPAYPRRCLSIWRGMVCAHCCGLVAVTPYAPWPRWSGPAVCAKAPEVKRERLIITPSTIAITGLHSLHIGISFLLFTSRFRKQDACFLHRFLPLSLAAHLLFNIPGNLLSLAAITIPTCPNWTGAEMERSLWISRRPMW
jgi:hypothetical protein